MFLRSIKNNSVNITFLSLLVVSLLLMSLDVKKRGKLNMLEEAVIDTASLAQKGAAYSLGSFKEVWFGYIYLAGLREENRKIGKEVEDLREKLNQAREAVQENQRLRDLLAYRDASGYRTVTAKVVGIDPAGWFKTITIGKGRSEGVDKGMAVVTHEGIVGRVLNSSSRSSRVLLITDRNSNVDAVIQRSRDRGIAEGSETELLYLKYLSRSADAAAGDILVTSGVGGIFPKGLAIGSISRVDKSAGGIFQYVEVRPAVDFSRLEEVLVVTSDPSEGG